MKRIDHKIAWILVFTFFGIASLTSAAFIFKRTKKDVPQDKKTEIVEEIAEEITETNTTEEEIKKVQKTVAAKPPANDTNQKTTTTKVGDKEIVTLAGGGVDPTQISDSCKKNASSPSEICVIDQTGRYGSAISQLKSHLANLRWSNEISWLYQITILDAGNTNWSGQYAASYTVEPSGDISSAYGVIYLNASYYAEYSIEDFATIMKWVLSHEYGHHYTQYHKWVDLDLPYGVRFPDEYYSVRPLSKNNTTVDCSISWSTCESEIIAEDYSYFYSGYGIHQMSNTFGYPSAGTKTWLYNLSSSTGGSNGGTVPEPTSPAPDPATPTDNQPSVSISSPANGATLAGTTSILANASDDNGIANVRLSVDSAPIADDASAPYQFSLNTTSYSNGSHTIKVTATDTSGKTAEASITVNISNPLTVNIISPESPFTWTEDTKTLTIQIRSSENIVKLKLYINNNYQQEINGANVDVTWKYAGTPAGEYAFKAEGYDAQNNKTETTLLITKQ